MCSSFTLSFLMNSTLSLPFLGSVTPAGTSESTYSAQVKRQCQLKPHYSLSFLQQIKTTPLEQSNLSTLWVTLQVTNLISVNTHKPSLSSSPQFKPYFTFSCLLVVCTRNLECEFLHYLALLITLTLQLKNIFVYLQR